MSAPQFHIGIKNNVTADAGNGVLELYFLDAIVNPTYYDWESGEDVEGSMVADVISQIKYYNPSKIICYIDSLGGLLHIAISLYNFLKDYPAKVECKIIGFCASAACILAAAANPGKLTMPATGFYITHEGSGNDISGPAKYIREQADMVERQTANMAQILASRNTKGKTAEEILALWADGDCWMTGTEACEFGFIDSCYNTTSAAVTARIDEAAKIYKNRPAVTASVVIPELAEETDETIIDKIKSEYMKFSDKVTAFLAGKKVTAKVTNDTIDVTATIEPLFIELTAQMQTEVTAEIETVTANVTTAVTAAMEEKYGKTITALETENAGYKTSLEKLTEDVTAMAGKESKPGGKSEPVTGKKERPGLGN